MFMCWSAELGPYEEQLASHLLTAQFRQGQICIQLERTCGESLVAHGFIDHVEGDI